MSKLSYETYLSKHIALYEDTRILSEDLTTYLKKAYTKYDINVAPYFNIKNVETEAYIFAEVNQKINKQFKMQFSNIGKNPIKRMIKQKSTQADWNKLEQYLIGQLKSKNRKNPLNDFIRPSNKDLAIKMRYIKQNEIDKDIIKKATRKITDHLKIIKDRGVFSIEQRWPKNKKGSYHIIRANWMTIIELYREMDPYAPGSIRFRKTIRYKVLTFIRNANETIKGYNALKRYQAKYWLKDLVTGTTDEFNKMRRAVFDKLKRMPFLKRLDPNFFTTEYILPSMNDKELVLEVKNDYLYDQLMYQGATKFFFKEHHGINCTIKPTFSSATIA